MIFGNTLAAWALGCPPEFVLGIFIASFGLLLYAFQGPLNGLLIAKERVDFSSVFNVLNQVTFVIIGTYALFTGKGYIGLLFATLAGILAMGITLSILILGKKLVFENNVIPLLRVILAGLAMGLAVVFVRSLSVFQTLDSKIALLLLIALGAVGIQAVSPGETSFLFQSITRKFRQAA